MTREEQKHDLMETETEQTKNRQCTSDWHATCVPCRKCTRAYVGWRLFLHHLSVLCESLICSSCVTFLFFGSDISAERLFNVISL